MDDNNLTPEEQKQLEIWKNKTEKGEIDQVKDLFLNCNSPHQFAKTHSVYIKDWEKTKEKMETNLKNNILPPGVSTNLYKEIISTTDKIIQKKLEMVRMLFENKFNESIYNYLDSDGKTKKLFGIFG